MGRNIIFYLLFVYCFNGRLLVANYIDPSFSHFALCIFALMITKIFKKMVLYVTLYEALYYTERGIHID